MSNAGKMIYLAIVVAALVVLHIWAFQQGITGHLVF